MGRKAESTAKGGNILSRMREYLREDPVAVAGYYWRLTARDERIRDQAHWCGVMRWPVERWTAYGDFYVAYALDLLGRFAGRAFVEDLGRKTALEWGCGGGANIRCLCKAFVRVYGLDISAATLNACERQMKKCNLSNFTGVLIPSEEPRAVLATVPPGTVDFILSIAVFQHFPSKDYTQRVLQAMEALLQENGLALIQVRYFDGSEKYRQKDGDYAKNVITMTSFIFEEFRRQLRQAGLKLLHSEKDIEGEGLCHEYYFVGKGD
jgi:hypothetical protein